MAVASRPTRWLTGVVTPATKTASLVKALADIDSALADNIDRSTVIRARVQEFRERIEAGATISELVLAEVEPRTVALLSENLASLEVVGSAFRVRLAKSLRSEGMTIAAVAELFGVTRQRISALLRQR